MCNSTALLLTLPDIDQVPEVVQRAIFGNIGSVVAFRVGERDADVLRRQFGATYRPETFTTRDNFHVIAKLLVDGKEQEPFLGRTLPPYQASTGRKQGMIERSRYLYARPRALVESRLTAGSTKPAIRRRVRHSR